MATLNYLKSSMRQIGSQLSAKAHEGQLTDPDIKKEYERVCQAINNVEIDY